MLTQLPILAILDYPASCGVNLPKRDGAALMSLTIPALSEVGYALVATLIKDFAPSKQHQLLAFTDTCQRSWQRFRRAD